MSKFLVLSRTTGDPKIHSEGSIEATACEIINDIYRVKNSADDLMALPSEGPVAKMVRLSNETYYSVEVTKNSKKIWEQIIPDIEKRLGEASDTLAAFEDEMYSSLSNLQDALSANKFFSNGLDEEGINVWAALGDNSLEDIDDEFRNKIENLYKVQKFN